ncbi:hypothetical protein [Micromonospora sp. NPDC005652]|uniref:Gp37-like protein n=1 Tax=Micromonospora sp. NPDC005652 TaxID=3157046 RepID=UPI0033DA8D23
MAITLLVTDRDLTVVGDPIACWETVDATVRLNAAGSAQFTTPAHPWIREQIDAAHRVVLIRDRRVFIAGPIEEYQIEQSDDGENSGDGKLTVTWTDDLALVLRRQAYPNPALTPEEQTTDYWEWDGNRELGLHALVDANAGPGARPERQVPHLVLDSPTGITATGKVSSGWELLGEPMNRLAGDDVGFRTTQDMAAKRILFQTFPLVDKSDKVRFGFGLGNLRYLSFKREAPRATTAIVGGQGEGADRYVIERTNAVAEAMWGRREVLVSRNGSDPVEELETAGDEQLRDDGETYQLQTSAWDTPDQRYPEHYDIGTRVSVALGPNLQVSERVQLVHLQAWATAGELASAMVGTQEESNDPLWLRRVRALEREVSRLGRTTRPASG